MAKSRIASRKKPAAAGLNSAELLAKCGLALEAEMAGISTDSKEAPDAPAAIKLPIAVGNVLHERRDRLHQVRACVAGAYAIAEANDDSSDVRWALELALEQFQNAIDSLEPSDICRAAQEASHGR